MDIFGLLDRAKKRLVESTNSTKKVDIEFVLYEFAENAEFQTYLKKIFYLCNLPAEASALYFVTMKKYVVTYNSLITNMTQEERTEFFKKKAEEFNSFILFLITQLKLLSEKDKMLAILITVEYFGERTLLGTLFSKYKVTREKLVDADQQIQLERLRKLVNNAIEPKKKEDEALETLEQLIKKVSKQETNKDNETPKETDSEQAVDEIDIIKKYVTDYGFELRNNKPNKLVGKTRELELIEESLFRKNKSGVVLVGKSGVGKDEIVNGFTTSLNNSKFFKDYTVLKLNTTALAEVNLFRGSLEAKVKEVLSFLSTFTDVILYIEDIHTLFNKIRVDDDIAHVLFPQLMKYKLKVIATCDYSEWTSIVEDNLQMVKYFQKILVEESSKEETEQILKKNIKSFEKYYGLKYSPDTIKTIVNLSDKYMFNKCFPEKAFDLLDMVSSKFKYKNTEGIITSSDIIKLFSEIQNIPVEELNANDLIDFKLIAKKLKSVVISQDETIDSIMKHIAINKAGLRESNKTVCNIFLKGESGIGKTLICQQLADALNVKLIRFDMSEYSEQHSVAKFLGTPPGYVGFSDANHGSLLISALEQNPRCVLLLDEIEKANHTIHNVLLQAMDNGKITSTTGKEVSLKDVILIMTSNVGATATEAISFSEYKKDNSMEHMNEIFKPEFKTRLDDIITMNPVSKIDINKVVQIELNKINDMLKKYKKKISWSKEVLDYIKDKVLTNNLGLRVVKHIIDNEIKIQIVEQLNKSGNLKIIFSNNKLEVKLCN